MPDFGQISATNFATPGTFRSVFRMLGNTAPNLDNMVLQSVSTRWGRESPFNSQDVRVAVYTGGSLTDPVGATLLEDLGTFTVNANTLSTLYTKNSVSNPTIPKNVPVWIAAKSNAADSLVLGISTSSADAGDWQSARGRSNIASPTGGTDHTVAFPSTLDGTSTFASTWYAWYLTYNVVGGSTPRRRTILRVPKNMQRAFKSDSRIIVGDTLLFQEPIGPAPTVGTGFDRRRMASYVKRGGVGSLKGRTT